MSTAPLIPVEVLGGIDDVELRRRAAQLPLAIDLDDPDARPLLWSLVFDRWPDLLSAQDLDNATRFYNQYFWFVRFASAWQAAHGHDAGLEQQAVKMLETAPPEAVWVSSSKSTTRPGKPGNNLAIGDDIAVTQKHCHPAAQVQDALVNRGRAAAAAARSATNAHLGDLDGGEGARVAVRRQGQVDRAERGNAEGQAGLLQGDQHAAADAAKMGGDVGQHSAERTTTSSSGTSGPAP